MDILELFCKSWKDTLGEIRKHKLTFFFLFLAQVIFMVAVFYLIFIHMKDVMSSYQGLTASLPGLEQIGSMQPYLEQNQLPSETVDAMLAIQSSISSLKSSLFSLAGWLILAFILGEGRLWLFAHHLLGKASWNGWLQRTLKFLFLSTLFLGSLVLITWIYLKSYFSLSGLGIGLISSSAWSNFLWLLIFVLFYFFLTGVALLNIHGWKRFLTVWLNFSVKKSWYLFPVYALFHLLIFGLLMVCYKAAEKDVNFWWALLLVLSFPLLLSFLRVFWLTVVQDAAGERIQKQ
ncbi:hypothetical protein HYU21_02855 [Candidatus Woesearchaeota archaeon]|nr:hypothetical protein [Candidatus Woesearchaeota archaeon]